MTNQELYDLMARFDRSTLQSLKLSRGDFTIELARGGTAAPIPAAAPASSSAPSPAPEEDAGPAVTAPLVGTFYAAPAPDQPPFVSVGDRVEKGRTLCLLEAMKNMVEVPAPCDCVIEAVLKENGELAAFGEALMRYKPC